MKWNKVIEQDSIPRSKRLLVKTIDGLVGMAMYPSKEKHVKFKNDFFAPMFPIKDSFSEDIGYTNYVIVEYWMELPE